MNEPPVYLDQFIRRESLLYRLNDASPDAPPEEPKVLYIRDLIPNEDNDPLTELLRKPDFQRATWAWKPEDCAELLRSTLNEQVVPSVIMWLSPENYFYVLDGAHRVSVMLAWLEDNWGDRYPSDIYKDPQVEELCKQAGEAVRIELKRLNILPFREYQAAYREERKAEKEGKIHTLNPAIQSKAHIYKRINGRNVGFPIQWVKGDYKVAEQSFLNINKRGSPLSEWETRLVENRNSSFARTVMAIANITTAAHCWSETVPNNHPDNSAKDLIDTILDGSRTVNSKLFQPSFDPLHRVRQPLMYISPLQPEQRPYQIAEFLTVIRGLRGSDAETERLMKEDKDQDGLTLLNNGREWVNRANSALDHLIGKQPQSLAVVPLFYFYNVAGSYVRSLLYGFMYWLLENEREILQRKRLFSAYRGSFEQAFLERKADVIKRIGRRIGSGTEVTFQTASYFSNLLRIIQDHNNDITTADFQNDHSVLIETLKLPNKILQSLNDDSSSRRRGFTPTQQKTVRIAEAVKMASNTRCAICNGIIDIFDDSQFDHIAPHSLGGSTTVQNARMTHPFCNNNRKIIEDIQRKAITVQISFLPTKSNATSGLHQFNFFDDPEYLQSTNLLNDNNDSQEEGDDDGDDMD